MSPTPDRPEAREAVERVKRRLWEFCSGGDNPNQPWDDAFVTSTAGQIVRDLSASQTSGPPEHARLVAVVEAARRVNAAFYDDDLRDDPDHWRIGTKLTAADARALRAALDALERGADGRT